MILIPAVILAADTFYDLRRKEIFPVATAVGAALGIMVNVLLLNGGMIRILVSLLPGLLFLVISGLSHGQTGAGDSLVLFLIGAWTGNDVWRITFISLFGAAAFAGVLWIRKKRNAEFPFVPFLTAGFAANCILAAAGSG